MISRADKAIRKLIIGSTDAGSTGIGLLTMLPVLLMGIGTMSVRSLRKLMGEKGGIACGTLVLTTSCADRVWFDTSNGLLMTSARGAYRSSSRLRPVSSSAPSLTTPAALSAFSQPESFLAWPWRRQV